MTIISATVIADTVSKTGKRITSMLVEYPRQIHEEVMTHADLSKSYESNRAVPMKKARQRVYEDPAEPTHWGTDVKGMVPGAEMPPGRKASARIIWQGLARSAAAANDMLENLGAHRSISNRVMSPYQHIRGVLTATEWDNFFALRCAPDADPIFHTLAWAIYDAQCASTPREDWIHLPFIRDEERLKTPNGPQHVTQKAFMFASAMRVARVSYGTVDGKPTTIQEDSESALLKLANPFHMQPFAHPACSLSQPAESSANFRGWMSSRALHFDGGRKKWDPSQAERDGWRDAYKANGALSDKVTP